MEIMKLKKYEPELPKNIFPLKFKTKKINNGKKKLNINTFLDKQYKIIKI